MCFPFLRGKGNKGKQNQPITKTDFTFVYFSFFAKWLNWSASQFRAERVKAERALLAFWVRMSESEQKTQSEQKGRKVQNVNY